MSCRRWACAGCFGLSACKFIIGNFVAWCTQEGYQTRARVAERPQAALRVDWLSVQTVGEFYSILLLGCETWPVRVADERMFEAFDNDSIRRILRVRCRDCVPSVELRRRLCLTSIPAMLMQRRLRWFGHAARRPEGELIKDLLLPIPPRTWRRRAGGQLKTWTTTIKADLEPISGP